MTNVAAHREMPEFSRWWTTGQFTVDVIKYSCRLILVACAAISANQGLVFPTSPGIIEQRMSENTVLTKVCEKKIREGRYENTEQRPWCVLTETEIRVKRKEKSNSSPSFTGTDQQ